MRRAERRDTFRGVFKYTVDGAHWFSIDRHGIPHEIFPGGWRGTDGDITLRDVALAIAALDAAPMPGISRHILG